MIDPKSIVAIVIFLAILIMVFLMIGLITPWRSNMKCHYCGRTISKSKVKHLQIDRFKNNENRLLEKIYHEWDCPYCGKRNHGLNEYQD